MATITVTAGQTISDIVLNNTGDLSNWNAILEANEFTTWVPILYTGQHIIIPDSVTKNLNNIRQFSQYPLNNYSVADVYAQIDAIFALIT